MVFSIVNGAENYNFSQGGLIALIAVIMVFAILLLIIVLTELINKMLKKLENNSANVKEKKTNIETPKEEKTATLNLDDEDMTVACLIASIEARNEFHKNVRVVSVKEVK